MHMYPPVTTHSRRFSSTLKASVEIGSIGPDGAIPPFIIRWEGNPRKADIKPYLAWISVIYQECANRWNRRIYVLLPSPKGKPLNRVFVPTTAPGQAGATRATGS